MKPDKNDWLEKDDLPEDTKATMYAQQLKNQVFRPEPSPVQMMTHTEQTMTSESDSTTPSQQLNATDKQIIDCAKLLIQKLKDHSDIISSNDNGQLVLEGSIVSNSNIVDLVNDNAKEERFYSRAFKHICQSTRKNKCTRGLSKEPRLNQFHMLVP